MLGTLNGALEVRGISLGADAIRASVEGRNEVRDKIPTLTEVHIHYTLRIPDDAGDKVHRALATHQDKCPTANSLKGAVTVRWTADVKTG